jgi:hypothetical protein
MLCSKERSSKRRIYKKFTSSCTSLTWLLPPFCSTAEDKASPMIRL